MSALLSMLANINRDPKKKRTPWKPDDFNPYTGKRKRAATEAPKVGIGVLKSVFVDNKPLSFDDLHEGPGPQKLPPELAALAKGK